MTHPVSRCFWTFPDSLLALAAVLPVLHRQLLFWVSGPNSDCIWHFSSVLHSHLPSLRPLSQVPLAPRSQISPAGGSPLSTGSRSPSELHPSSLTRGDQSDAVLNFCPWESTGMNAVIKNMAGAIQYFQMCIFPQNSIYIHLIYLEAEEMNQKRIMFLT